MKSRILFLLFCVSLIFGCSGKRSENQVATVSSSGNDDTLEVQLIEIQKKLTAPVFMTHAGDDRLFVVEQRGVIKIMKNEKVIADPFLDISSKVDAGKGYSEKGLLGLAFHPDYKNNGRFFVYYSSPFNQSRYDHKSVVAEYKEDPQNPDKAATNEKIILEIPQPESNHNGGMIAFGPDGYLYIASGDGGGAGDRHGKLGNAQDMSSLLGKMLRIDVDSGNPYSIPPDNPFLKEKNARPEIYALGLRNPWRFSFDSKTGEIFCGDVGQNEWEEIDIIRKGGNYGWRIYEAFEVFDKQQTKENLIFPIHHYPRSVGILVIGGYVYRGESKVHQGTYFFADWNGKVFSLVKKNGKWQREIVNTGDYTVNSLGEDQKGNLYILAQRETGPHSETGIIYRLGMGIKKSGRNAIYSHVFSYFWAFFKSHNHNN
jgi:glucose/arabinose dehydrogenase